MQETDANTGIVTVINNYNYLKSGNSIKQCSNTIEL